MAGYLRLINYAKKTESTWREKKNGKGRCLKPGEKHPIYDGRLCHIGDPGIHAEGAGDKK